MALEQRNGRVYFYTSRRVGGRVVKQYAGAGELAELAAQLDTVRRQECAFEARDRKTESDQLGGQNAAFRAWFAAVDGVIAAALEAAGWHRVRRQWRKQRGATVSTLATVEPLPWVADDLAVRAGLLDPAIEDRASKGDRAALKEVNKYLDQPAARALWGDLGRLVLRKWVDLATGKNELTRRAMLRFAADLRAKLAGPDPSALDTLLAERVVLAMSAMIDVLERADPGGQGLTTAEIVDAARKPADPAPVWHADLKSAVEELCGRLDGRALGYRFRHFARRNFGG